MNGNRFVKGLFAVCLAILVMLGSSTAVMGAKPADETIVEAPVLITPQMLYINSITLGFDISSTGLVTAYSSVYGYPGVSLIISYLYVEKYSGGRWVTDRSWMSTTYGSYAFLYKTYNASHGYTYRLKGSFYVYDGGSCEHTILYSATEYY